MHKLFELKDKIEKRISEYIGFDVKEIFEQGDFITIYGGSVRDSIADMEIHDVDILCMPNSATSLAKFLESRNYTKVELYSEDNIRMYREINLISEPFTFINDKKIIQIIRPSFRMSNDYRNSYIDLIKNVDISCCGVYLEHNGYDTVLMESCKNAIAHCMSKVFEVNEWSKLYNTNRTIIRSEKLINRGWFDLHSRFLREQDLLKKQRAIKLSLVELPNNGRYKVWTEEEYRNRPKYDKIDDNDDLPF